MFTPFDRRLILAIALLAPGLALAATPQPVIFFTDLQSGPNAGGQNNKGVFVTLYGRNFGATRGSSTVTLGGTEAGASQVDNYPLWSDTKICVQLGAANTSGSLIVSVPGVGSSNAMPFTIRPGNIYFVSTTGNDNNNGSFASPWRTLRHAKDTMVAGDTTYGMNGIVESGVDPIDGREVLAINVDEGTAAKPIALCAYPGATVTVDGSGTQMAIFLPAYSITQADYFIIAGLTIIGGSDSGITMEGGSTGWRIVGNDISAPIANGEAAACGGGNANFVKMLGNNIHNVATGLPTASVSKLMHDVYWSTDCNHIEVGWNIIHDNAANRGIQFHSSPLGGTSGQNQFDLIVHDNLIYNIRGDGINFATVDPSKGPVEAYNNVIVHVGTGPDFEEGQSDYAGIYIAGGTNVGSPGGGNVLIYNNTIYDAGSRGGGAGGLISLGGGNPNLIALMKDNILYSVGGEPYFLPGNPGALASGSNNLFFGNGNGPSVLTANINADPKFANAAARDFHLLSGSPAIDAGVNTGISADFDGIPRPQGSAYDVGAYEFYTGSTPPPAPPTINAFTATPATVTAGSPATLAWTVSNASSLSINQGVGTVSSLNSVNVTPQATTTYTLTATNSVGSVTATATVTVTPALPGQTLLTTQQPPIVDANDGVSYELGMRFQSDTAGQITAIRFWKSPSETGTHTGNLWDASGSLLATVTFSGETSSGWQEQALSTPLSVAANTEYLVSVNTGGGYYVADDTGFATQIVNGHLSSIVGGNGRYGSAGQYPTQTYESSNYFRDVRFVAGTSTNHPPVISSPASATPNPALTGQSVSFSAAATDADNDPLTYAWNFGDGASGSGASTSHAYAAAGSFTATVTVTDGKGGSASSSVSVTVNASSSFAKRINSGGGASGTFAADANFSGGNTYRTTMAIDRSGVTNPAPQAVYQTERYGNFTYTIGSLSAGATYTVRLHFAEIYWSSAGKRIFNVAINGQQVLANFDIYAAASGKFKAIVKEFNIAADASGQIAIVYKTVKDNAKSSGIEVLTPTATVTALSAAAAAPDSSDSSLSLSSINLGSVKANTRFKLPLETPENGAAGKKLHWTAVKGANLPQGLRASGALVGGKIKTAGTYSFDLQLKTGDSSIVRNTYSITVQP